MSNERYEWVKAIVCGDELRWEYKLEGSDMIGGQSHDEDVSDWTEEEIKKLTCMSLELEERDLADRLTIEYR